MKKRWTWVDAIIIIVILIAGAGVYFRYGNVPSAVKTSNTEFTYVVELKKIRNFSVDALQNSVGLQFNMDDTARADDMGTLINVDIRPATEEVRKSDGTAVLAEIPNRYDAYLTFVLNGYVSNTAFLTPQFSSIGAGAKVTIKSKWVKAQGNVVSATEPHADTTEKQI